MGSPWTVLTWGVMLIFTLGKHCLVWRMDCVLAVGAGRSSYVASGESGDLRQDGGSEMLSGCISALFWILI